MFTEFWQIYAEVEGKEPKHKEVFENRWAEQKRFLRELLGGNVYEEKISLASDPEIVMGQFRQFLSGFSDDERVALGSFFFRLDLNELVAGRLNEDKLGFQKGTKLGKVLIKYLRDYGIGENADSIVSQFSNFLQRIRSEEVTIRISIDPLDILLASENTTGWKTCHSLSGAHRTGNLAYIVDKYTAIAYAYKSYAYYHGLELPKKMWRQFIYIDVEGAAAYFQRQYPSDIPQLFENTRRIIEKLLSKFYAVENPEWVVHENPIIDIERGSRLIYLDQTILGVRLRQASRDFRTIYIGAEVPCPVCGVGPVLDRKNFSCHHCNPNGRVACSSCGCFFPEEEVLFYYGEAYCESCFCANFVYCTFCEITIPHEDAFPGPDGSAYCRECYNRYFRECDFCGEVFNAEDIIITPNDEYCCEHCFEEYFTRCIRCEKIVAREDVILIDNQEYCRDCAKDRGILVASG